MRHEVNVLALLKGPERYVFVYDEASRAELITAFRDHAADPALSFSWFDAAVLTRKAREQAAAEAKLLNECLCPACRAFGIKGLRAKRLEGFSNRACHNLWVLLQEVKWIRERIATEEYAASYKDRLDNTIYLPLV